MTWEEKAFFSPENENENSNNKKRGPVCDHLMLLRKPWGREREVKRREVIHLEMLMYSAQNALHPD